MEKNDAVIMHWGVSLIPFHVEVSWTGDLQPANLAESVILLEGGEDYCIRIISPHTIVTGMCIYICIKIPFGSVP